MKHKKFFFVCCRSINSRPWQIQSAHAICSISIRCFDYSRSKNSENKGKTALFRLIWAQTVGFGIRGYEFESSEAKNLLFQYCKTVLSNSFIYDDFSICWPGAAVSDDDNVDDGVHDPVPEGEGTHSCEILQHGAPQQQDPAQHHVGSERRFSKEFKSNFWRRQANV